MTMLPLNSLGQPLLRSDGVPALDCGCCGPPDLVHLVIKDPLNCFNPPKQSYDWVVGWVPYSSVYRGTLFPTSMGLLRLLNTSLPIIFSSLPLDIQALPNLSGAMGPVDDPTAAFKAEVSLAAFNSNFPMLIPNHFNTHLLYLEDVQIDGVYEFQTSSIFEGFHLPSMTIPGYSSTGNCLQDGGPIKWGAVFSLVGSNYTGVTDTDAIVFSDPFTFRYSGWGVDSIEYRKLSVNQSIVNGYVLMKIETLGGMISDNYGYLYLIANYALSSSHPHTFAETPANNTYIRNYRPAVSCGGTLLPEKPTTELNGVFKVNSYQIEDCT